MIHLIIGLMLWGTGWTMELPKLNPDAYTLLPQDPGTELTEELEEEIPLVYEDRTTETIIIEDEPLVLRPEEDIK